MTLPTPTGSAPDDKGQGSFRKSEIPTEQTVKPAGSAPQVGQWIVARGNYGFDCGEVSKASAKQIRTVGRHGHEDYHRPSSILFAGTEAQARTLFEVLVSLNARHSQARQQLADQHQARIDAAILKATGEPR